jgi:hypothetical protein
MCDYDFLNIELNKCYHHFCSRWNEDSVTRTPKYAKKERKGEHPDKQPHVSELFDIISDKISISILRLVSGQGEMTSPQGDYSENENSEKKNFYSIISKLEIFGLLRMGEGNTKQPTLLGNVVFNVITTLDIATNVYMKLRTIYEVELSGAQTKEEMDKLVDSLIEDDTIKSILKKMTTGRTKI